MRLTIPWAMQDTGCSFSFHFNYFKFLRLPIWFIKQKMLTPHLASIPTDYHDRISYIRKLLNKGWKCLNTVSFKIQFVLGNFAFLPFPSLLIGRNSGGWRFSEDNQIWMIPDFRLKRGHKSVKGSQSYYEQRCWAVEKGTVFLRIVKAGNTRQ